MFKLIGFLTAMVLGAVIANYVVPHPDMANLRDWWDAKKALIADAQRALVEENLPSTDLAVRDELASVQYSANESSLENLAVNIPKHAVSAESMLLDAPSSNSNLITGTGTGTGIVLGYAVWAPFTSRLSAQGFVDHLQKSTNTTFRIEERADLYHIMFDYQTAEQLANLKSRLNEMAL